MTNHLPIPHRTSQRVSLFLRLSDHAHLGGEMCVCGSAPQSCQPDPNPDDDVFHRHYCDVTASAMSDLPVQI